VFTANLGNDSVSIINLANSNTVTNIDLSSSGGNGPLKIVFDESGQRIFAADSGFDTGDIRTFVSNQQTLEQITCINFVGQCSGNIYFGETRECTVEDDIVSLDEVPSNGDSDIVSSMNNSQQNQLFTNEISGTGNKIQTSSVPTGPLIYDMPKH
jgi:DNA-binding beta-propeller fold protein YncE